MILALLALALQSAPTLLEDPGFRAAHGEWIACTNGVADAEAGSARQAEEIAAAALAACTERQEAVRRAVIAFSGRMRGQEQIAVLVDASREGLSGRVRERRRRAAAAQGGTAAQSGVPQTFEAASLAWAQCTKNHVDAAPAGERDRGIVDAALASCTGEEAAVRAAALRMLGSETRAERMMIEARTMARNSMRRYLRERR